MHEPGRAVGPRGCQSPTGVDDVFKNAAPAVQLPPKRRKQLLQYFCAIKLLYVMPKHAWLLPSATPKGAHQVLVCVFEDVRGTTWPQRAWQQDTWGPTCAGHQELESLLECSGGAWPDRFQVIPPMSGSFEEAHRHRVVDLDVLMSRTSGPSLGLHHFEEYVGTCEVLIRP